MGRMVVQLEAATPSDRVDPTDATTLAELNASSVIDGVVSPSNLEQETAALSENIIRIIKNGNWESLLPNTGTSVEVGHHHICVSYDEESSAEFRTWEWQGHILVFEDAELSYVPEYIYGNYFEPLMKTESSLEGFLDRPSHGLTELINNIEERRGRAN